MKQQLQKLWDPAQAAFADIYTLSGAFSTRLTPTIFYPLMNRGVATSSQAEALVERHLTNSSEFCISANYTSDAASPCYWGLPSVAVSDRAFMQPPNYIYWRGLSWGPMSMLTWWALDAFVAQERTVNCNNSSSSSSSSSSSAPPNSGEFSHGKKTAKAALATVEAAKAALAKQKSEMMMSMWRRNRHICENYSPYSPQSIVAPGNDQRNKECTGWQFNLWGALNGLIALLEEGH